MKSARNPAYCCRKWVRNWANIEWGLSDREPDGVTVKASAGARIGHLHMNWRRRRARSSGGHPRDHRRRAQVHQHVAESRTTTGPVTTNPLMRAT